MTATTPEGGDPAEILSALAGRVRELFQTGEVLEAVGAPDETIDNETGLEIQLP